MASSSPNRGGGAPSERAGGNPHAPRSSSPLAFPSSPSTVTGAANGAAGAAGAPSSSPAISTVNGHLAAPGAVAARRGLNGVRSSSPLAFPPSSSSSSPARPAGGSQGTPARNTTNNNPLFAPGSAARSLLDGGRNNSARLSSSPGGMGRNALTSDDGAAPSSEPLFFPSSATPKSRRTRGDIHSSLPLSPSPLRARGAQRGHGRGEDGGIAPSSSAGGEGGALPSSQPGGRVPHHPPSLSNIGISSDALEEQEREAGTRTVIWNTTVGLDETMNSFKQFLTDFKMKYRVDYLTKAGKPIPFTAQSASGDKLVYEGYLRKMRLTRQTNLNLDLQDLEAFPPTKKLARWMRTYPQEVVPMCDQVLKDCMIDLAWKDHDASPASVPESEIADLDGKIFKIRPFGTYEVPSSLVDRDGNPLPPSALGRRKLDDRCLGINMRDLNPQDIDKLVTVKGLVIRCTPIIPDMKVAFFRCLACSHTLTVDVDRGQIAEPDRCPRELCNLQGSMSLIHNRCEFSDRQVIRLQETPDVVPDGQTPHTVSLCVYDELVDLAKPGDRVVVTGIFRSVPVRVNPRMRTIKSLFKTYVDILHVRKTDKKRLGVDASTRTTGEASDEVKDISVGVGPDEEEDELENATTRALAGGDGDAFMDLDEDTVDADTLIDPGRLQARRQRQRAEQEEKLVELSRKPNIYEVLSNSLAPSIWEMDDVKKGILLQLFGGTNKSIARGGGQGGPRYRGDINVLLVGDPGTSKSQILQYVHKIAPRGVYTSGKGSSAVGLTAYVTRDPDSKQLVLESGALVLSDGGVCCIDEFDKMSDATRSVLHEVMEQQTVSIAKAGIITTLNARTSILAAANPVGSKYNLKWPITRNIDLPPTLISRFDLLYLVLDKPDESNDRRLAKHLVSLYLEDRPETGGTDILPLETLTAYISYARTHIHPELTAAASDALVNAYVTMRSAGIDTRGGGERRITATTRQLESMIRLSEAHARMRFSDKVELKDVEEANRLIREALKESATDPVTGLIDLDLLNTGHGLQQRKMHGDLRREVLTILEKVGTDKGVRWTEVAKILNDQSSIPVEASELTSVIKELEQEGQVAVRGTHDKRTLRKLIS